jgi:hypothetical protein
MSVHIHRIRRPLPALAALVVLTAAAGCSGGRVPVTGKVAFADGSPLAEGMVICETQVGEKTVSARGKLTADGSFQLGTYKPGDGALPGKYRVLVVPRALTERELLSQPPIIDPKFEQFDTSGLAVQVAAGQPNVLNFTVTKAPPKPPDADPDPDAKPKDDPPKADTGSDAKPKDDPPKSNPDAGGKAKDNPPKANPGPG